MVNNVNNPTFKESVPNYMPLFNPVVNFLRFWLFDVTLDISVRIGSDSIYCKQNEPLETLNEVVYRIWGQYIWTPANDQFAEEVAQVIAEIKHGVPVKENYCKEDLRSDLYYRDETIATLRYQK
ncbi:hypothetical protein FDECE_4071 [Fusarium decemcellulare]|nr:hypothetical protein FDECE_4071 [Fusarium decemcellulare]